MSMVTQASRSKFFKKSRTDLSSFFTKPSAYVLSTLILTGLSSATTLAAPALLTAEQFASFVLLASFFQLAARLDFGLSELADRYGHSSDNAYEHSNHLIQGRWLIAIALMPFIALLSFVVSRNNNLLSPLDLLLALSGGLLAMVAVGPVTVSRAKNNIKDFAILALTLQLGMTVPRLIGLVFGGTTGCYLALSLWYLVFATQSWRTLRFDTSKWQEIVSPLRQSLPLFLCALMWLCTQFMPRWISASISSQHDFAQLAFAFNLMALATGTLTTIGQAYYPRYLVLHREQKKAPLQNLIWKDLLILVCGTFVGLAIILPLIPYGLYLFYPRYYEARGETLIMVISLLPLVATLWYVPFILAISRHPLRSIGLLTLPTALGLIILIAMFYRLFGVEGQAFAVLVSSLIPILTFAWILIALDLSTRLRTLGVVSLIALLTLILVGEAHWIMIA
jgi:O-antigen/teichoic acid export membrane protein